MNKVKTIKIKNEDGSVSEESYSIAADALNVDMSNGYNLQETVGNIDINEDGSIAEQLEHKINSTDIIDNLNSNDSTKALSAKQGKELNNKLNKKPYYYETVADMKADTKLKVGDMTITLGYYEANDGGGAEYKIVNGNYEDDGCKYHELSNNLFANLIIHGEINVLSCGIKNTGATTQPMINKMLEVFETGNISFYFPSGTYKITETIYLPTKTKIRGDNGGTIFLWDGNTEEYMFNILSGHINCVICDLYINGNYKGYGIYDCDKTYATDGGVRSRIYNIRLDNMKLGIHMNAMGSEFHNILCNGSGNNGSFNDLNSIGFYITGTDNFINNCRVQTFYYGALIIGSNNRLVTVKTCVNQIGTELRPGSSGFYNIDLQENYQDNLIMINTKEASLIINNQNAGIATTYLNGDDLQYSLIQMIDCSGINIKGTLGARTKLGNGSCGNEKYALYINDNCTNITGFFSYIYYINNQTVLLDKPIFYCKDTITNKITINNEILNNGTEITPIDIQTIVKPNVAISLTSLDNILTTIYPNDLIGTNNTIALFDFTNWEDAGTIFLESSDASLNDISIQMLSINNKVITHHLNSTSFLTWDKNFKQKFYWQGLNAFKREYKAYYEELLEEPIRRYIIQIMGYIINSTVKTTLNIVFEEPHGSI